MRPPLFLFLFIFIFISPALRAEDAPAPFEIKDGDRVLFLGDVLLEREGTYGYLETRMQEQFPDRHFTVRNLSFSGDTPLGWSRASFDPPAAGFDRLKEQLALVKPTVVFLGYGMAASLQEMTDRSGDITLNPDTVRYGAEPYSAARFKKEMGQLMDAIVDTGKRIPESGKTPAAEPPSGIQNPVSGIRFVLLSPIRHEDLRAIKPGLPDPAGHNKLLEQYSKVLEELAEERGGRFVDLFRFEPGNVPVTEARYTDNGIHLNENHGYAVMLEGQVAEALAWPTPATLKFDVTRSGLNRVTNYSESLRAAITKKNELFFHRWRPENQTYLFGFRKHEQGQNAKEIPEFDPLIAAVEAEIDKLKRAPKEAGAAAPAQPATAQASPPAPADTAPLPLPQFDLDPALEITLWAETPLLAKPTEMNWDAAGRLWVTSSGLYPMIAPGGEATDKVLVLEDPDHVGHATKSTVFAEGLLVPTGVEADFADTGKRIPETGKTPATEPLSGIRNPVSGIPNACYVGASTELLRFEDLDGDGKADQRRIVLSGFGTEDTHHILHTLRWGPDGRLYFDQSIYIHSHLETPWGMVRMNSGAVMAYDPRTERVEVCYKGFCNPWGHAWDKWGQEFITDGAGGQGLSWGILGAMYFTYENGKNLLPSISPGSYPKFASLELIQSPHFPADWQGDAITCDFRAHRIVRFHINDLGDTGNRIPETGKTPAAEAVSGIRDPKSGFITTEMPDIVRTTDVSFRPIDVKLGPDGALYVADWSNPVINHGEVDFRDPRRDHTHGRIWRISVKGSAPVKWESMVGKPQTELLEKLLSENLWEKQQATRLVANLWFKMLSGLTSNYSPGDQQIFWDRGAEVVRWQQHLSSPSDRVTEVKASQLVGGFDPPFMRKFLNDTDAKVRAACAKVAGQFLSGIDVAPILREAANWKVPERIKTTEKILPWLVGANAEIAAALSADPSPRVRLEAMRTLARIPVPISASLVLTAALNAPKDDPYYAYAAALSINDLAQPWTEAIARGEWTPDSPEKQQQLAWGLANIRADLATATLAKLVADHKVPLDGSGPWIELLGQAGGAKELRSLLDALAAGKLPADAETRALNALADATRLRNTRPEGDLQAAVANFASPKATGPARLAAGMRLLGLWHIAGSGDLLAQAAGDPQSAPEVRAAAFEALKNLGGDTALKSLDGLASADRTPAIRRAALVTLAQLKLDAALAKAPDVFPAIKDENEAVETWRGLLAVQGAPEAFAASFTRDAAKWANVPKPPALRAAREAGQKGQSLANALAGTPAPGAPAPRDMKAEIKHFAEAAVTNGHPIEGEAIYHRIGCVVCHSIGGAGGKFGPDFTSLGASAPLDYIVESVLDPAAKVKEGFIAFSFTMKDGSQAVGIPTRETATEQFIRPGPGPEIALVKANIVKRDSVGSLMPAGLIEPLKEDEKLSLFAFLSQVGKPGPFDASKSTVARVWWLFPSSVLASAVTPGGDAPAVIANVDGALPKQRLIDALPLLANAGDGPKAVTKFQLATAGKVKLNLTGIREAWLDGQGLAVASEPSPTVDLPAGVHIFAVRLDPKALPDTLRVESGEVRFLTE